MAINGIHPVLLVGLTDVLTPAEAALLKQLSNMSYSLGTTPAQKAANEAAKAANEATAAALKQRATVAATASELNINRLPIVFDGEIIPASATNYSTTMVKQLSISQGANIVTQAANTVTVNIETSRSVKNTIFVDLLFSIADIIFAKSDFAPNVSYFGGSVVIPNGWLIRLSRSGSASGDRERISMEIAKDLSFLTQLADISGVEIAKPESVVSKVTDGGIWQWQ